MKKACIESFLGANPRLVEAVYLCEVITGPNQMGNVHTILSKRRAVILDEKIEPGTNLLIIQAHLPVIQSFNFYKEII